MSGATLEVDTTAIGRAAEVVEQAADAFGGSGQPGPSPMAAGSLGPTDTAHAVVAAAAHGLARAQDATRGLAERSHTMAGAMRATATMFDLVDSMIGAGR